MTAVIHELRRDLERATLEHGRRSSRTQAAFERLVRGAAALGEPIDGLRINSADETERFFARTVPGPDGHVYWTRGRDYTRNDGRKVVPRRWWWQHIHGEIDTYLDVVPTCGAPHCINPEHCESGRSLRRMMYTESAMIGALQVGAMRLGHTPNQNDWVRLGLNPTRNIYVLRFGSWLRAIEAAGLPAPPTVFHTDAECLAALRDVREKIGHWPFESEYQERWADGMPSSITIERHFGGWVAAREAAIAATNDRRPRHPSPEKDHGRQTGEKAS